MNHAMVAAVFASRATVHTVVVEGVKFTSESLTVNRGEMIVWVNKDFFPHTATAQGGTFDSRSIAAGKSRRFTATRTGVFPYLCTLRPSMTGTVIVKCIRSGSLPYRRRSAATFL